MAEIKIDEQLLQAISTLISGAMATGNQQLLPAIIKVKEWMHIVIESSKKPQESDTIVKEDK